MHVQHAAVRVLQFPPACILKACEAVDVQTVGPIAYGEP